MSYLLHASSTQGAISFAWQESKAVWRLMCENNFNSASMPLRSNGPMECFPSIKDTSKFLIFHITVHFHLCKQQVFFFTALVQFMRPDVQETNAKRGTNKKQTLLYSTTSGQKLNKWPFKFYRGCTVIWAEILFQCVLQSVCQIMFLAATEKPNAHMLLLISAKSRLQLCQCEFPSLWALTQTQPPTDGAQPAPVRETPPLSLSLHLTTSALY